MVVLNTLYCHLFSPLSLLRFGLQLPNLTTDTDEPFGVPPELTYLLGWTLLGQSLLFVI